MTTQVSKTNKTYKTLAAAKCQASKKTKATGEAWEAVEIDGEYFIFAKADLEAEAESAESEVEVETVITDDTLADSFDDGEYLEGPEDELVAQIAEVIETEKTEEALEEMVAQDSDVTAKAEIEPMLEEICGQAECRMKFSHETKRFIVTIHEDGVKWRFGRMNVHGWKIVDGDAVIRCDADYITKKFATA